MKNFFKKYISQIIIAFIIFLFAILYFAHTLPRILQSEQGIQEVREENLNIEDLFKEEQTPISKEGSTSGLAVFVDAEVSQDEGIAKAQATLIAGELNIKLKFNQGQNLHEIFIENNVIFQGKEYPALGFFVTDLGSLHEEMGKYLVYYINGKEATVGVSSYIPEDNDVITWELK